MFQILFYFLCALPINCLYGCANPANGTSMISQPTPETQITGNMLKEWCYINYSVRFFDSGVMVVYQAEKPAVIEKDAAGVMGMGFDLVTPDRDKFQQIEEPLELKDITGDGITDLIIQTYSGGAHCCYTYFIYSLGVSIKRIAKIHTGDSRFEFRDLDGDAIYEMIGHDVTFNYWQASHATSPMPEIILRYTPEGYRLALDLMTKPAPAEEDISKQIQFVQSQFGDSEIKPMQKQPWADAGVPVSLWGNMLELIYSGNSRIAWKFFDRAWPKDQKGKLEFFEAFLEQLRKNPYWIDLELTFQKP